MAWRVAGAARRLLHYVAARVRHLVERRVDGVGLDAFELVEVDRHEDGEEDRVGDERQLHAQPEVRLHLLGAHQRREAAVPATRVWPRRGAHVDSGGLWLEGRAASRRWCGPLLASAEGSSLKPSDAIR